MSDKYKGNCILVIADAGTNFGKFAQPKYRKDETDFGDTKILVSTDFNGAKLAIKHYKPELTLVDPDLEYKGSQKDYPKNCGGQVGTSLLPLAQKFSEKVAYYTQTGRKPEDICGGTEGVTIIQQSDYQTEKTDILALYYG